MTCIKGKASGEGQKRKETRFSALVHNKENENAVQNHPHIGIKKFYNFVK